MAIKVIPSNEEDASILVPLGILAFSTDAMNKKIFDPSKATPEQNKVHLDWRIERHKRRNHGNGKYYFKAVDEETAVVCGYSAVFSPEVDRSNVVVGVQGTEAESGEKKQEELKLPASTPKETVEFMERLEGRMKELEKEVLGEREDVWCKFSSSVHFLGEGLVS